MTGVDDELRMLIVEMNQEANLTTRNRNEKRVHRVINRYPGRFLRQAARKALAGEFLNEDEFVLTHLGYLPEEWNAKPGIRVERCFAEAVGQLEQEGRNMNCLSRCSVRPI
jgi:hypothetical protein